MKFITLLIKEVRELLTPQMILPFIIIMFVFSFIGDVMRTEQEKTTETAHVMILDLDDSSFSKSVLDSLNNAGIDYELSDSTSKEDAINQLQSDGVSSLIVINAGFKDNLDSMTSAPVDTYSIIDNFSLTSTQGISDVDTAVMAINEIVSTQLVSQYSGGADPQFLKLPVTPFQHVVLNGKTGDVAPSTVVSFIMSQITFIPIVLFLVITVSSQLVATAVATEKENKTLETLLSSPIDRKIIVAAKIIAAGLVSLIIAATYLYGMQNFMNAMTSGIGADVSSDSHAAMETLGLVFSTSDYLILGAVIFLGILVALSTAFILGVFAKDARSAQTVISPIMVLLLIPYMLTMFVDIQSMSTPIRVALMAIPFTHTFTAATNILVDNYSLVGWGILYLLVILIVGIILAAKIFTTEKVLTLKLPDSISLGKRK